MVNAMVNLNPTFMQEFMVGRLTEGSLPHVQVTEYSNAVDSTSFDTMMAALATEVKSLLQAKDASTPETMRKTLRKELSQLYTKGQSFYDLEMEKTGNLTNLAAETVTELKDMIYEANQSGKSTLNILERQHLLSLKTHEHSTFRKYFSDNKCIGTVYSDNERKDEAAHLYRLDYGVLALAMNSLFVMNAPEKSIAVRLKLSQRFLAVKAVLTQANLLGIDSLTKEAEHMRAFAMVLEGWVEPSKFGINTGWDKAAIRYNSPPEYKHGSATRNKGLQALMNPLIDFVRIDGVHPEVFVTLAMNLGMENLEALYALIGEKIDLRNTTKTMLDLEKKQKLSRRKDNRNTRSLTTEHKRKISDTREKMLKKMSKEVNDVRDARNSLYDDLSEQGLINKEKGVQWEKQTATWRLVLPSRFFGIQSYIASFDYLDDANEAMKQFIRDLDRGLDGGVRLPDSLHYDIENERNKKVFKTAIENARQTSKKKNNDGRGKKASDNIIKSRVAV